MNVNIIFHFANNSNILLLFYSCISSSDFYISITIYYMYSISCFFIYPSNYNNISTISTFNYCEANINAVSPLLFLSAASLFNNNLIILMFSFFVAYIRAVHPLLSYIFASPIKKSIIYI